MRYLNVKAVRMLANQEGKRVGKDFLLSLDMHIEQKIIKACSVHNGGKVTLDSAVAVYVGINRENKI